MTKHYFVSYLSFDNGVSKRGHALIKVTNQSLLEITKVIEKENGADKIIITCLKDLREDEFNMLMGE